jgi:hypothetical protein
MGELFLLIVLVANFYKDKWESVHDVQHIRTSI